MVGVMRIPAVAAIALSAACGGAHHPVEKSGSASNQAKPPTCSTAADVLRRKAPDLKPSEVELGNVLQEAIRISCDHDGWSLKVIDCIAATPAPFECLDPGLTADQARGYQDRLERALDKFSAAQVAPEPRGPDDGFACYDIVDKPTEFGKALTLQGDALAWAVKLRAAAIENLCRESRWDDAVTTCFGKAVGRDAHAACNATFADAADRDELAKMLATQDDVAEALGRARKEPAKATCQLAADVYYNDAQWEAHIDGYEDAERDRYKKLSKAKLAAACKHEHWDDALRACLVAGGNETCFEIADRLMLWTFPARGLDPNADKDWDEHHR